MKKAAQLIAMASNIVLFISAMLIVLNNGRLPQAFDVMLIGLLFVVSLSSLYSLKQGPDLEERKLMRRLRMAELRHRLAELGEGEEK